MKAILVIDMPNDCVYCPCWRVGSDEFPHSDCTAMQRPLTDEEEMNRPSWCPLKHPLKYASSDFYIYDTQYLLKNLDREYELLKSLKGETE